MFFNFLNFLGFFFWNFQARVGQERNSGLNFFSLFLDLSQPSLDRNNAGMIFYNFLNFFAIFFGISSLRRVRTEFGTKIFIFSSSSYLISFWLKIMPERGFLNFLNFFAIFFGIYCPVRVGTKFGTKIVFFLSLPISSRFGYKIMPE